MTLVGVDPACVEHVSFRVEDNRVGCIRRLERPGDAAVIDDTARRIATLRATPEAREGLSAFLQKRPPAWMGA